MSNPPQRRPLDFHDFDAVAREARSLLHAGYDRAGRWTLAQAAEHLTAFMRASLDGFDFTFPWYMRLGGPIARWSTLRFRRIPAGVKGPPTLMPRELNSPADEAPAVDAMLAMLQRVDQHPGEFHPSPLLGRLTREQWRQVHLIHAAHHLSFLIPRR